MRSEEDGDLELIRRSAVGDRAAFAALVARHQAAVFRFARAMTGDDAAAEDALQETFLSVWRAAATFRSDSSLRSWMLAIMRNAVNRQHRRRVDEPLVMEPLDTLGVDAGWGRDRDDPEALALARESRDLLARAMGRLDSDAREVLTLRELEELSGEETATILGISIAATKTRLHRARLKLAAAVRNEYETTAR